MGKILLLDDAERTGGTTQWLCIFDGIWDLFDDTAALPPVRSWACECLPPLSAFADDTSTMIDARDSGEDCGCNSDGPWLQQHLLVEEEIAAER